MFDLFDKVKTCYRQLLLKENEPPKVLIRFVFLLEMYLSWKPKDFYCYKEAMIATQKIKLKKPYFEINTILIAPLGV